MNGSGVGKRYATALIDLATEAKVVDKVGKDLAKLAATWKSSDELRSVFENPQFGTELRRNVITQVSKRAAAHKLVVNIMQMLSDRGRLGQLEAIQAAYERLSEQKANKVRATIVSASRLPESYYKQIQKAIEKATDRNVAIVREEDPSLIGGVVTKVGDSVYDGSIRNQLRELREELLKASAPAAAAGE